MPSKFLTDLEMKDNRNGTFSLLAALIFFSVELDGYLVVPKGFKTDLASIPQAVQNVVPKLGRWNRSAVLHDCLYAYNGATPLFKGSVTTTPEFPFKVTGGHFTKNDADHLLDEAMFEDDVDPVHRRLIYEGVHFGGDAAWNEHANDGTVYDLEQARIDIREAVAKLVLQ